MRQILALCTALAFTLSLAGAAFAQGTTSPGSAPSGSSATSPSGSAPDTTKSTVPKGSATGTDTGKSTTGAAGKSDTKSDADKGMAGRDKAGAGKTAGGFRGVHTMKGEITKIDQARGMYTFKSEDGMELELHAPPTALQGMKEGDRVEVQLGVRPAGAMGAGAKVGSDAAKSHDASKIGAAKSGHQAGSQPKTQ